jgi:hypothetical protein
MALGQTSGAAREVGSQVGGVLVTRYYALVLVPGDPSEEEACETAAGLLYPYMRSEDGPGDYKFDWFLQPDDLAEPGVRSIWRAGDIVERFSELEVEAILTPDGRWHAAEAGQLWDDQAWVARARQILQRHQRCLALRHVLHI